MPFKSEKQRRYMHANLPDIAKRWERDYSNGGIAELNQELNSLPEYYMPFPAAQGGLIPAHEAGIYGLEDGGNIRFQPHTATDLLVQKTSSGERPKYQPPGHRDAPAPSSRGPRDDPDRSGQPSRPTVSETAASEDAYTIPTQTVTAPGDGDAREKYISEQYKKKRDIYGDVDLEEQQAIDREIGLRRLQQGNISKQERQR